MPSRLVNRSSVLAGLLSACLALQLHAAVVDSARATPRQLAPRALIVGLGSRLSVKPYREASIALLLPRTNSRAVRLEFIFSNNITTEWWPHSTLPDPDYRVVIESFALGLQAVWFNYREVDPALNIFYGMGPRISLKVIDNELQDISNEDKTARRRKTDGSYDNFFRASLGATIVLGFSYRINEFFTWHGEYGSFFESYWDVKDPDRASSLERPFPMGKFDSRRGLELYSGVSMGLAVTF
ncbi:MAG: hypothetical protein V3W14_08305 [Candidatus Neomarinimicrobiota bacterium]